MIAVGSARPAYSIKDNCSIIAGVVEPRKSGPDGSRVLYLGHLPQCVADTVEVQGYLLGSVRLRTVSALPVTQAVERDGVYTFGLIAVGQGSPVDARPHGIDQKP